jgi:hypothetical protein
VLADKSEHLSLALRHSRLDRHLWIHVQSLPAGRRRSNPGARGIGRRSRIVLSAGNRGSRAELARTDLLAVVHSQCRPGHRLCGVPGDVSPSVHVCVDCAADVIGGRRRRMDLRPYGIGEIGGYLEVADHPRPLAGAKQSAPQSLALSRLALPRGTLRTVHRHSTALGCRCGG